jgi:hypothetical protein
MQFAMSHADPRTTMRYEHGQDQPRRSCRPRRRDLPRRDEHRRKIRPAGRGT